MTTTFAPCGRHDETIARRGQFLRDVLHGLARPQKEIPCKYFYDERGSELFDRICELDEYYLTRAELAILARARRRDGGHDRRRLRADRVRQRQRDQDAAAPGTPARPAPICRSTSPRNTSSDRRARWRIAFRACRSFPSQRISPLRSRLPETGSPSRAGSSIFRGRRSATSVPSAAVQLWATIARLVGAGGGLLIGFDLDKDESIVWPAYNDRRGVTAAFNLEPARARSIASWAPILTWRRFATGPTTFARKSASRCIWSAARPQIVTIAGNEFSFASRRDDSYRVFIQVFARSFRSVDRSGGFCPRPASGWTRAGILPCSI